MASWIYTLEGLEATDETGFCAVEMCIVSVRLQLVMYEPYC